MEESIEIRYVVREQGKTVKYEAIKGTIWTSGWDERLADRVDLLEDGPHIIMFKPDGEDGSDGFEWVEVYDRAYAEA